MQPVNCSTQHITARATHGASKEVEYVYSALGHVMYKYITMYNTLHYKVQDVECFTTQGARSTILYITTRCKEENTTRCKEYNALQHKVQGGRGGEL